MLLYGAKLLTLITESVGGAGVGKLVQYTTYKDKRIKIIWKWLAIGNSTIIPILNPVYFHAIIDINLFFKYLSLV